MQSPWEYLVEKRGLEGARAEMRRRRSLVKTPGFLAMKISNPDKLKQIQLKALEARKKKL